MSRANHQVKLRLCAVPGEIVDPDIGLARLAGDIDGQLRAVGRDRELTVSPAFRERRCAGAVGSQPTQRHAETRHATGAEQQVTRRREGVARAAVACAIPDAFEDRGSRTAHLARL